MKYLEPIEPAVGPAGIIRVGLADEWVVQNASDLRDTVRRTVENLRLKFIEYTDSDRDQTSLEIDCIALSEFDSVGAYYLTRLVRELGSIRIRADFINLEEAWLPMISQCERATDLLNTPSPELEKRSIGSILIAQMRFVKKELGEFVTLLGAVLVVFFNAARGQERYRIIPTIFHIEMAGVRAIPVTGMMSLIVGAIITQQAIFYLKLFGAEQFVVDMLGILTVRELSILIPAVMVAGRTGSSIAAELGLMRMREEIDALSVMRSDVVPLLVAPRFFAMVLSMPVLAFISGACSLLGGGLVAVGYGGIPFELVLERVQSVISASHVSVALIKAPVIGAIVVIASTLEGFRVEGRADSLARCTTLAVVKSLFLVILADGLFALFFSTFGI